MTTDTIAIRADIAVTLPSGTIQFEPEVIHTTTHETTVGFRDTRDFPPGAGPRHRFDVVLTPDNDAFDDDYDVAHAQYQELLATHLRGDNKTVALGHCGTFLVGWLSVAEFSAFERWNTLMSWHAWLDGIDGDLGVIGRAADIVRDLDDDSLALNDGSLFYFERMEIHPAFRGQQVGLRLMGHAMVSLARASGDTAFLLARPCDSCFQPDNSLAFKKPRSKELARLAQYYERAGFQRVYPKRRLSAGFCVPMYCAFMEKRPPFTDWPRW